MKIKIPFIQKVIFIKIKIFKFSSRDETSHIIVKISTRQTELKFHAEIKNLHTITPFDKFIPNVTIIDVPHHFFVSELELIYPVFVSESSIVTAIHVFLQATAFLRLTLGLLSKFMFSGVKFA